MSEKSRPESVKKPGNDAHIELFENVFDSVNSLIAYLDRDFRFIRVNEAYAEANAKPPEFFPGKCYFDLFPDGANDVRLRQVAESGESLRFFERPFGLLGDRMKTAFFDWSLEPVRHRDGHIMGLVLTLIDVTERRRAKEALRESEAHREEILSDQVKLEKQLRQGQKMEALGTLAGGIAHDLNNILMPIIMNAEMIVEDVDENDAIHHFASKILSSAHRGRHLVRRILTFSREKDAEKRRFSIADAVTEALDLVRPTLLSTVDLRQAIPENAGSVEGDPAEIQEVIVNLCTNAAHAVGTERGVIEVTLATVELDREAAATHADLHTGPYAQLSVRDTGVGMNDALMERIFDPFFTTKKPGEGTGMGLAMVHGAVRRHGGALLVNSSPGDGTVFDIYLPRASAGPPERESSRPVPRGRDEHILLVDDEEDIVEAARQALTRLGYRLTTATNGERALDLFRAQSRSLDLVILDFALARMTGVDLARQMRKIRPEIPIVMATGFTGAVDKGELEAAGIGWLVSKPLGSGEVAKTIRRALDTGAGDDDEQEEGE